MLASREAFLATLLEQLVEETSPQFRKGKRRAMTKLDVVEERAQDASRQWRRDERLAATLAAADRGAKAQERERQEEEEILASN
jgi:TfoX/Sxy family transcriptional regulator of competence genes